MKYGIWATAFLLTSAGFALADYVVIVANVGASKELKTAAAAGANGMGGMQGGMNGNMMQQQQMQMQRQMQQNMRGGSGGFGPGGPGMGGGAGGGGGAQGNRGGSGPVGPGGPGMGGMQGNGGMMQQQQMQRQMQMQMQMRGGMGGGMGGMMNMMTLGSTDADDVPDYVIAVVEVKPVSGSLVKTLNRQLLARVELPKRLGKSCYVMKKTSYGEMFVITEGQNKALPTVASRFHEMFDKLTKEQPSVSDVVETAQFALEHGLVDKFPAVMDKLIQVDKTHPAAVAYPKIKAELERKAGDDPAGSTLRSQLLAQYKVTETPHYFIIHNAANDTAAEVKTHIEHLENAFRGFYYWFALKGVALSVPRNRQVVVMTRTEGDFENLRKILTPAPVVVDGFFARREKLGVMYSQRQDDTYQALSTYWENYKSREFRQADLLAGNGKLSGAPQSIKLHAAQGQTQALEAQVLTAEAQMIALMLKALEQEAELATVSHQASRQLLFTSGLLPRNVAAPEWILFGMGSFFETPLQSPWPTIGAPSPYYLPRWRELKAKASDKGGLEKTPVDTLRKVVTDAYFRSVPPDAKGDSPAHLTHEAALRKARTAAWSLTYFLAQQNLDGLRRYFAELSKLPRDIEFDDKTLFDCFARAFGCMDANGKLKDSELKKIASDWYGYWQTVHFESEETMREIRKKIAETIKQTQTEAAKKSEASGSQPTPNAPPSANSGAPSVPGKPGATPPGMNQPQQNTPQQRRPNQPNTPPQGGRGAPTQPQRN